jgi:phosphoglycerate dehydrogenase-like enzyme
MRILVSAVIAEAFTDEIRAVDDAIEVAVLHPDGSITPDEESIEVAFKSEDVGGEREMLLALAESGSLRWLHTSSAGIDNAFYQRVRALDVTFTHSPGVHAIPIAEWVLAQMLHFARHLDDFRAQQERREWRLFASEELRDRTLGIVGYGGIGREVARLAHAFGMTTIATRRTPVEADPYLDRWLPPAGLDELVEAADYLVLCAPLTEETHGLLDARRLGRLQSHAVLINVARGAVVDQSALVEVLRDGRIRGAALDVFAEEPLPADSPLWSLPNTVVSPHASGESVATSRRTTELFIAQLKRYLDGASLEHLVEG